tara:strand:+ start:243 stop:452 length:210 start_codon:yes stop_codon:yes gene_type:complete
VITKKHFNKIAELSRTYLKPNPSIEKNSDDTYFEFVQALADFFESDNPNFHRGKFIHACYNSKGKKKAA